MPAWEAGGPHYVVIRLVKDTRTLCEHQRGRLGSPVAGSVWVLALRLDEEVFAGSVAGRGGLPGFSISFSRSRFLGRSTMVISFTSTNAPPGFSDARRPLRDLVNEGRRC